ncbi:MAG: hypothetical protein ABIT47_04605, partial [Candidatus Paceibacterota bacterium]
MPDLFETNISNSLVSTKIASDLSGYNPDYLARVCREGKIKGAQIGRSWLIDKNSLEQFVALQQERKRELALQTAKVREQEYKIANAVVPVTDHIQKASNVAAEKARSVISPIQRTQFALPIGPTRVHRPLVAAAVALVFTVGTAYASTAPEVQNILAQLPQNVQHVADLVTRPRAIDDSFRITETTSTHKTIAADLNVPSAKNISRNFAYVTGAKSNTYAQTFAAASITASTNDSQSSFASAFSSDNNARVAQSRINAIGDAVMHPSEVASAFVNGYVHTGATIFAAAQSIGDAYLATVRGTADTSLAVASVARDIVADAPENTDGLLALYEQGVYGWVDSSHDIAQATAGTMYDTGSVVGELATNLPNAVVQTRGALADMWVDRSLAIANSAADAQTDVGTKALAVADSVGSRYLGAVDTSGSTLAGAYEALPSAPRISVPSAVSLPNLPDVHTPSQQVAETAQNAAQAIASGVPENVSFSTISDLTQDAMLGMAGKIMAWAESNTGNVASTNEGSNTSVATNLTASVISFAPISWQRTIEHLLVGAGELAQALIHAGVRAIADTFSLPGAFAPELAVVPFGPTQSMSLPHPTNIGGVAINTSATTTSGTVIKGPTTYIQNIINNFSKDAFGASFNDAVLAIVGPYVRSSIDSAISSVRGGGGGGDVTSSNAHLTNVTISGGTATLSSADIGSLVAGSTTTGSLTTTGTTTLATTTVNGDLTVTGTISAGSLAVTSVTSDGPVIAPYFTATSTTGTSTFPNLAATNAVIDNATTTNFFTTNLSAVAANITNAVFGSFVSNLANITTATITNLTGTNSQFVNSTTTNATTTNFYATNGVIDNATTTNFFSLNGFIDTFFSTFANIATAVITNLTGTNSQFVNSTTTNSVATNATTTNLSATNADITNAILTNATSTNFAANNGVITNLTGTNATSTNSFATNANFDNATSTNFFSALGSFTNAIFGSFVATLANITTATITNLTGTNSQFVNSTTTNVTTTNLFAANATTTNFSTTNGAITNLTSTNAQLGNATTTNLAVTGLVGSDLIPAINNQYSVGSPGATWSNGYFDSIHVNNFFVASTSIDGTASNVFSINSDNASVDAEDSTLVFNRGTVSPNATLTWNSTLKRFDFSHPIQTPSLSTASFTLGSSTFTSLLGAGLADVGGALTVTVSSTSLALDSTYFKQGGNSFGSTATIGTRDNNPLNIITNNAVAGTFLASGFLGLGTTSPTERLSVAGNAVISGSLKAASLLTTGNANVGSLTIGSLSGFLKATAGAVSTALVDLSTDVTSTLPVGNGGTGIATPPSLGNLLVGNGSGGYSLTSTSTLGLGASYFQQNGNSFGATATLGTNDNNDLVFETNNVERLRVNTSGQLISNIASAANTPAFTWASDLTTGIFHPAINQIGFSTGGIQRIVVDGNGNLGVGSSSPNARLTVKGAGTTTGINFQTTNSSDVPLITVLDSGNVGIGTTTPAALLSVGGITTTPAGGILLGDIQIYRSNPSNIAFGPSSIAVTANNFTATTNFAAGSIGSYFGSGSAAAGAPAVTINTNTATRDNLVIHQAASQTANTLRIEDSSANILSTLTPVGASNSRQQFFLYNTLETTPTNYERLAIYPDSTNNVFRIDAQIGGTGVRRNLILQGAGGNVGIGTTSPFAKLTVVGDLSITGGGIYDNNSTRGTLGQILQTTGTGIQWVSTTSLGFASSSSVGSANQVAYYNSGGVLGGTSGFTFDGTNLSVGGTITAGSQFIGIGGTGAANTPAYTFSGDLTTG